jgi:hypothetical protein
MLTDGIHQQRLRGQAFGLIGPTIACYARRRVQDLFHSVQLNVNNPHFLIMQGRITKVLNMKPPEILAMLEEAAGTKMYVQKSKGAMTMLQKKEKKLADIEDVCTVLLTRPSSSVPLLRMHGSRLIQAFGHAASTCRAKYGNVLEHGNMRLPTQAVTVHS